MRSPHDSVTDSSAGRLRADSGCGRIAERLGRGLGGRVLSNRETSHRTHRGCCHDDVAFRFLALAELYHLNALRKAGGAHPTANSDPP